MTTGSIALMRQLRDRPWVVLIRDPACYTTAMYMERALMRLCNIISIPLSFYPWLPTRLGSYLECGVRRFKIKIPIDLSPCIPPHMMKGIGLILVMDPIRFPFIFKGFDGKTAYYAIDGYNPPTFESHICDAHVDEYDYVFVAAKFDVQKFRKRGCKKVFWLPLACDPQFHRHYDLPMKYDVSFVGSVEWQGPRKLPGIDYDARKNLIAMLKKNFNIFVGRQYLHDMAVAYSQSKIVFNKSRLNDLNMRIFEALGCGRLLVTDYANDNGLLDLFVHKKHLVLYDNLKDLIEIVRYYIDSETEREEIALQGQREAYARHTYLHRANHILSTIFGQNYGE